MDLNTSELAEGPSKCLVGQYSQENEDEIIQSALAALPSRDRWCVEFGAWDGIFASNSRRLIKHYNYSAILIEADVCRFKQLRENYKDYQNVVVLRDFVGWQSNTLDTILSNTPAPKTFDLLSIDIDGNDYHVWKALSVYRPKLVCIEFNPTVATSVRFVQSADSRVNQGCSLASLVDLAKEKNYELIAVSHCNAFFVDAVYYQLFGLKDNHPASLRRDCAPSILLVTNVCHGTVLRCVSEGCKCYRGGCEDIRATIRSCKRCYSESISCSTPPASYGNTLPGVTPVNAARDYKEGHRVL